MSCLMQEHQTLLFAATMAADIRKLAQNRLHDPQQVSLIEKRAAPVSIEHYFVYLHPKNKQKELITYLEKEQASQVIIFCNARHKVDRLFHNLRKEIKNIEYIHSGLSQGKRTSIFRNFKNGKVRYLIATDVAGRGLDFSRVSHIMNWDFPNDGEAYTHRTGRSGRMGRKGKAFTFVTKRDLPNLRKVIRKKKIDPLWVGKDPFQENKRIDEIKPKKHDKPKTEGKKRPRRSYRGKGKKKTNHS
jgi:ATP-dependent RNA helicase DeaD